MEFDWRNTGDYVRVADAAHSSAPPLRPLLFLVPRQRDLPRKRRLFSRAVSGSLCVCARSLLITDICSEFRLLEARPLSVNRPFIQRQKGRLIIKRRYKE